MLIKKPSLYNTSPYISTGLFILITLIEQIMITRKTIATTHLPPNVVVNISYQSLFKIFNPGITAIAIPAIIQNSL